jgi:CBS domain-containing protein
MAAHVRARSAAAQGMRALGCRPFVSAGTTCAHAIAMTSLELEQSRTSVAASKSARRPPVARDLAVRDYMISPIQTVAPDELLEAAAEPLSRNETSCLVVMEEGRVIGLLTRSDLVDEAGPAETTLLPCDPAPVATRMARGVVQVEAAASLVEACRTMIEREVHQVVVVEDGLPVGTLSRWDAIAAARDLRLELPIGDLTTPVSFIVGSEEPVSVARAFLEAADVSTVLVMDGRFPVGVFGKREAIRARDAAPGSAVGWAMNRAVLVLSADLPLHHAAAQMMATGAHLVVVVRDGLQAGVVTATNFTELFAAQGA